MTMMKTKTLLGSYKNGTYETFIYSDGTRIRQSETGEFIAAHPENMDIKICDKCNMQCPMCHEGSLPNGKLGDIMNEEFINTLYPYQELAIGGGNIFEHPQLVPFLYKLKGLKVISNITVNQMHFEKNYDTIKFLVDNQLVYGIGISLVNPTDEFIQKVKEFPNAIIHTINGILTKEQIERLADKDLKILILGYKDLRRGYDYHKNHLEEIEGNMQYLYDNLMPMKLRFHSISFDNLAIDQLDVRRLMTDEEFALFYQGFEGSSTFYVDMVTKKFAKSSTAPANERYVLLSNVDDMFAVIQQKDKGEFFL